MAQYLLAAEADRIQDLLFRSSQLREVVGGSQLLSRFCDDVPELVGASRDQVVTSGGGSFRVTFETKDEAKRFGAALAEVYHRATGGTLSVAEPVKIVDDTQKAWKKASEEASESLRQAKRGGPAVATPHFPYVAFCESCGVGLAEAHEARFEEPEGHYLCHACRVKAAEREERSKEGFLKDFYDQVPGASELDWPNEADDVAQYDPRGYVAYIVADGDGMGRVFGACSKEQAAKLSEKMDQVLREALAEPTHQFLERYLFSVDLDVSELDRNEVPAGLSKQFQEHDETLTSQVLVEVKQVGNSWAVVDDDREYLIRNEDQTLNVYLRNKSVFQTFGLIPVLPLILGGDDLFALVPACWGLDFAQRLCRTFQREMTAFVREEEITLKQEDGQGEDEEKSPTITMSAAVVICKANYPYYLAHQIGEERLGATKRAVKALGDVGPRLSAVDFEVVLGSQAAPDVETGKRRRTLRPYWVPPEGQRDVPDKWGLALSQLLDWRHRLVGTPSRRRSQLRDLFDRAPGRIGFDEDAKWNSELSYLLERIERGRAEAHPIREALEELGSGSGVKLDDWYSVDRASDKDDERPWDGHGLPDLLRAWDWALSLDHPPIAYEGGER